MLMSNVLRRRRVNGVLCHVGGVITDAFETARNKNQVQIAAQLRGIFRHSFDETPAGRCIHLVEGLVSWNNSASELDILAHVGVDGVLKHRIACVYIGMINSVSANAGC